MTKRHRAIVVGTGFGAAHVSQMHESGLIEVDAIVYGSNRPHAETVAASLGVKRICASLDEALQENIDLVAICSPVDQHEQQVLQSLQRGCRVVCDKPLSLTAETADGLADAADSLGLSCLTYFQWRLHPALLTLKKQLSGGRFGRIIDVSLSFNHDFLAGSRSAWAWRHRKASASSGAVSDLGIHMLDLFIWLTGKSPALQTAWGAIVYPKRALADGSAIDCETEDIASATFSFDGDASSFHFHVSRVATGSRCVTISITGENHFAEILIDPDTGGVQRVAGLDSARCIGAGPLNMYALWLSDDRRKESEHLPTFRDGARAQRLADLITDRIA